MAKHKIIHSEDATTILIEGDIRNPEPTHAIIRFPGGFVEVARCSDGSYYAHIGAKKDDNPDEDRGFRVVDSRIDYDHEKWMDRGIPQIPEMDHVRKLAMRFARADAPILKI